MSLSSKQLEHEIAAMEGRLASVKVTVEIEKDAWKKVARKGKAGTKWRGAATASGKKGGPLAPAAPTGSSFSARSDIENVDGEIVVEPLQWDSLELAQYLQSKQLGAFAQIAVYEQITGRLLLETAPGKLKGLFTDVATGSSDPTWKSFLRECSRLHKLQKSMERKAEGSAADEREQAFANGDADGRRPLRPAPAPSHQPPTLFPVISPRIPPITASAIGSKPQKPAHAFATEDAANRMKTPAMKPAIRKPPTAAGGASPMATCWNCGARFPRTATAAAAPARRALAAPSASAKPVPMRSFCSKTCQDAIEASDMSVSASLSLGVMDQIPKPPSSGLLAAVVKSPRHRPPHGASPSDAFDFLHIAHKGPAPPPLGPSELRPPALVTKQASSRKRLVLAASQQHTSQTGISGGLSPVASITAVRCLPDDAIPPSLLPHGSTSFRAQSRLYQQSKYKLDPEMFHAHGANWATCFDVTLANSPSQRQTPSTTSGGATYRLLNLETLAAYLSTKTVYHLSLACRKWFELLQLHTPSVDRVWGALLRRAWVQTDEDKLCLRELGFLSAKTRKPRRVMMKMARHMQKLVLENTKVLLNGDNWQLAPVCREDVDYVPLPQRRELTPRSSIPRDEIERDATDPVDRGHDLYEVISVVYNRAGEFVAVQAQELIRAVAEDGSTMAILTGLKNGSLRSVACRRLRLFSATNRLPFNEWYLLPDVLVALEFCDVPQDEKRGPAPTIWHLSVLSKLQKAMAKRLLGKESVQQSMKWMQERNAPPQAFEALEQFLHRHSPTLLSGSGSGRAGRPHRSRESAE